MNIAKSTQISAPAQSSRPATGSRSVRRNPVPEPRGTSETAVSFEVPAMGEQPHVFRTELLLRIRQAVARAYEQNRITVEQHVEICRTLKGEAA